MTDKPRVTVKKPDRQQPGKPMTLEGEGQPGEKVAVKGVKDPMGRDVTATVGPDGKWGAHGMAPMDEGVYEVSVESTGATSSTTFPVGNPERRPKGKK